MIKFPSAQKVRSFARAKMCTWWKMRFFPSTQIPRWEKRDSSYPGDFALEPSVEVVFVLDPFTETGTLENSIRAGWKEKRSRGDEETSDVSTSLSLESLGSI